MKTAEKEWCWIMHEITGAMRLLCWLRGKQQSRLSSAALLAAAGQAAISRVRAAACLCFGLLQLQPTRILFLLKMKSNDDQQHKVIAILFTQTTY